MEVCICSVNVTNRGVNWFECQKGSFPFKGKSYKHKGSYIQLVMHERNMKRPDDSKS